MTNLTAESLKLLLYYNRSSGQFVWIGKKKGVKIGSLAGSLNGGMNHIKIRIAGKNYYAHRLAWLYETGKWPSDNIDHIDGNPLNNSFDNLREANQSENCKNSRLRSDNSSGVVGVCWYEPYNRWTAQIHSKGKNKRLGYFESFEDAVAARKAAEVKYGFHPNHGRSKLDA